MWFLPKPLQFIGGLKNLYYVYLLSEVILTLPRKPLLKLVFLVVYDRCNGIVIFDEIWWYKCNYNKKIIMIGKRTSSIITKECKFIMTC